MVQGRRRQGATPEDALLAAGLARGLSQGEAGERAHMSPRTVRRRLEDPEFRATVARLRVEVMAQVFDELLATAPKAARTLDALLDAPTPPNVRLAAARTVLEDLVRYHDAVELEHRVRMLEGGIAEAEAPRWSA